MLLVLLIRRRLGEAQGLETKNLEFGSARGAREDLAAIHIEFRDSDRVRAERAGRHQSKSIRTTREGFSTPHSTSGEKEAMQKLRRMPDRVRPVMSRLRG